MPRALVPDCNIPDRYEVQVFTSKKGQPILLHRWSNRRTAEEQARGSMQVGADPTTGKQLQRVAVFDRVNQVHTWDWTRAAKRRG